MLTYLTHTYKLTNVLCKSHCPVHPQQFVKCSHGKRGHLDVGSQARVHLMSQFPDKEACECAV